MLRAIHHIALKVVDLDACTRFYREVLELPLITVHHDAQNAVRSVWLQLSPETILMLERATDRAPRHAASAGWHLLALTIARDERDALEQRLASMGVQVTGRTAYTLYISDPEGNRLGLSHHPHA